MRVGACLFGLGRGLMCSVLTCRARRKDNHELLFAVKTMQKEPGVKMELLHNEIAIWTELRHEHLVRVWHWMQDAGCMSTWCA